MSLRLLRQLAAAWMLACIAHPFAHAHKASDAYLHLRVHDTQVEQRFDIALRDLDRDLVLDADGDGRLSWGEVRTRWGEIDALAQRALALSADGRACTPGPAGPAQLDTHSDGRYAVLTRTWACASPVHRLDAVYTLFAQSDRTHRGIARVRTAEREHSVVLVPGPGAHGLIEAEAGATRPWVGFVAEGVHHILIGADHVLFLIVLLLPAVLVRQGASWHAAPSWRATGAEVLRVVTAFTLAHSITLALAVLDVWNPPSRGVETLIAASVAFAAANNLRPMVDAGRWKLTFAFGLVHGFGFAGALKDLGLGGGSLAAPLVGFNLGVELGQLALVALVLPLAWALRHTRLYQRGVLVAGSSVVGLVALLWLVERGFDLQLPAL